MSTFTPLTWGGRSPNKALLYTGIFEIVLGTLFFVIGLFQPIVRGGFFLTAGILWLIGVIFLVIGIKLRLSAARAERLQIEGISATATVAGMRPTSVIVNGQPMLEVDFDVTIPGKAPYRVTRRETVPPMFLMGVGVGQQIPVMVDPADPMQIVVGWGASLARPVQPQHPQPPQQPTSGDYGGFTTV